MSALRTTTPAWASAPLRVRAARKVLGSTAATRLFLDRQVDFWLGELAPAWSLSELRASVLRVVDETHDVKTFVLAPGPGWPGHQAGQYVAVDVEIDGARLRRCYSISSGSSAPGDARVAITVKRVPGGRVSGFLHDNVRRGSVLVLGVPTGDFVLGPRSPEKLLLLSGGSGVTPVMSLLRDLSRRDAVRDIVFLHAARSASDVIFRDELRALAERHAGLRVVFRLGDAPDRGPLDEAKLRAEVPDFAERGTFLCGPPGMMDTVERVFARVGATDRLRSERFVAAPRARSVEAAAEPVTLRLSRSGRSIVASAGTLLEQLERAGERPAYGCRLGICNTCRCRKRSGTVENTVTGAVSSEPDDEIRLCVSVARSDLDIDI
jgi:ferredoxin-NADP reductase